MSSTILTPDACKQDLENRGHVVTETPNASMTLIVVEKASVEVGRREAIGREAICMLREILVGGESVVLYLTTAQKAAMVSPPIGLSIFDVTTGRREEYTGTKWEPVHNRSTIPLGWAIPATDSASIMKHEILGRLEARLVAVTVDAVPTSQNHAAAKTGFVMVNITTLTSAGTLRLTGTSYDPATGNTTGADTEDIVVSAAGWFVSTKRWRGAVALSSVGGLDVVLDSYFWNEFVRGFDWILDRISAEYLTTGATNQSRIHLQKFTPGTGFTTLFDETISNLAEGKSGSQSRTGLTESITESAGHRVYMFVELQRCTDYHFDMRGK